MTLKDIANEAGVATSTVSRILNNKGSGAASKEVQDRVWEIVRRTGYVPNASARSLRTGRDEGGEDIKRAIACVFARTPIPLNDPFFSGISRGIEEEAFLHNFFLRYSITAQDLSNLEDLDTESDARLRGIAILGRCDQRVFRELHYQFKNIIYVGLNNTDVKCDQVLCDGFLASKMAVEHLIGLGHRRIGYIGETVDEKRFNGYRETLIANGLHYDDKLAESRILSFENGYAGMQQLLERAPEVTAIFCANDQTAIGAMKAANQMELNVPRDISIVSIDDIEVSQFISPSLTTVHIPTGEMGRIAAKLLIDRIRGGHSSLLKTFLPCYLVERDSCARPRAT